MTYMSAKIYKSPHPMGSPYMWLIGYVIFDVDHLPFRQEHPGYVIVAKVIPERARLRDVTRV